MRTIRGLEKLAAQEIKVTGERQKHVVATDDALLSSCGGNAFAMRATVASLFTQHGAVALLEFAERTGTIMFPLGRPEPPQPPPQADAPAAAHGAADAPLAPTVAGAPAAAAPPVPTPAPQAAARLLWHDSDSD